MSQKSRRTIQTVLVILLVIFAGGTCGSEDPELMADIEKTASLGEDTPEELIESITRRIEAHPSVATRSLLPRLADAKASERQLAVYTWALGLARDPKSVDAIILLAGQTKSELVKGNCLRALATIGGQKSGEFLLSTLDKASDSDRFDMLDLLAEMQYEAALPKMEEVLKKDPNEYYWQCIFVFGKMGDKAVPFLLKKVSDNDRNVRLNAIGILGQYLIPVEAVQALHDRYWKETDSEIRNIILSSLEVVTPDLNMIRKFSEEVIAKENDKQLVQFARETIENLKKMEEEVDSFRKAKRISAQEFQREYDQLYKSVGKTGDYKVLSVTSSLSDEPKLKKLRERILQRNSDESFYDYQEVNRTILLNRLLKKDK